MCFSTSLYRYSGKCSQIVLSCSDIHCISYNGWKIEPRGKALILPELSAVFYGTVRLTKGYLAAAGCYNIICFQFYSLKSLKEIPIRIDILLASLELGMHSVKFTTPEAFCGWFESGFRIVACCIPFPLLVLSAYYDDHRISACIVSGVHKSRLENGRNGENAWILSVSLLSPHLPSPWRVESPGEWGKQEKYSTWHWFCRFCV